VSTGPQHYRAAERRLADAFKAEEGSDFERYTLAEAQVHAILALAAAMGTFGVADDTRAPADLAEWENAAGEHTAQKRRAAKARAAEREEFAEDDYVAHDDHEDYIGPNDDPNSDTLSLSSTPLAVAFGAIPAQRDDEDGAL
jgi:hypothetical protein